MELNAIIEEIKKFIFLYDINGMQDKLTILIEKVSKEINDMDSKKINTLNEILRIVNTGINNRDYLLVADVLEYELLPLLSKSQQYYREELS